MIENSELWAVATVAEPPAPARTVTIAAVNHTLDFFIAVPLLFLFIWLFRSLRGGPAQTGPAQPSCHASGRRAGRTTPGHGADGRALASRPARGLRRNPFKRPACFFNSGTGAPADAIEAPRARPATRPPAHPPAAAHGRSLRMPTPWRVACTAGRALLEVQMKKLLVLASALDPRHSSPRRRGSRSIRGAARRGRRVASPAAHVGLRQRSVRGGLQDAAQRRQRHGLPVHDSRRLQHGRGRDRRAEFPDPRVRDSHLGQLPGRSPPGQRGRCHRLRQRQHRVPVHRLRPGLRRRSERAVQHRRAVGRRGGDDPLRAGRAT